MGTQCREIGTVLRPTSKGEVVVQIKRAEACHACAAKGACQSLGGSVQDFDIVVENRLGARTGDRVVLSLAETSVLTASAVLYLIPAFLLVVGALFGWVAAPLLEMQSDPSTIVGSLIGLATGLAVAKLVGMRLEQDRRFLPELTAIESRADEGDGE